MDQVVLIFSMFVSSCLLETKQSHSEESLTDLIHSECKYTQKLRERKRPFKN